MPNCNAEYLLERLRSSPETSSIPVIVQTAKRLSPLIRERLQRTILGQPGAARIIRKSFEAAELFEALQRVCGFAGDLNGERLYR
jgi:CheY-like chemotaxis protein